MGFPLEMYRVQPWTKSLVLENHPRLKVKVDTELCFTSQAWGAVLDDREWFTSRAVDRQTIRVPAQHVLPVYETNLSDATHKVLLGEINVPTMYVCAYDRVPTWLALANGAHTLAEFREGMRSYKPDITQSWPVSFYQLDLRSLRKPN